MRRTRFLIWKELIELGRDPRLLFIVIFAPIIQLGVLAYAATTDIREVPVLIVDADRSSASRDIVARFAASPTFMIVDVVSSPNEIDAYLDQGRAWLAVTIPRGFADGLHSGAPADDPGDRRRQRRELGGGGGRLREQPAGAVREPARVARERSRPAGGRSSIRGSASGSTRSSRAVTS